MSRIGKQPIAIPGGVEATFDQGTMRIKGPKGQLEQELEPGFEVEIEGNLISVKRPSDQKHHRARHGLYRSLINNMVRGVSLGYEIKLEIEGVGYNARVEGGRSLTLNIGFCHPVTLEAPEGVELEAPKPVNITVKGSDKQKVGQMAADIRRVRPPEPYKGKGIRYAGEKIRRKAGKAVGGK